MDAVLSRHGRLDAVASLVGNVMMAPGAATGGASGAPAAAGGTLSDLEAACRINLYTTWNVLQASSKASRRGAAAALPAAVGVAVPRAHYCAVLDTRRACLLRP